MKKLIPILCFFLLGATYEVGPDSKYKTIDKLPPLKQGDDFIAHDINQACPRGVVLGCYEGYKPKVRITWGQLKYKEKDYLPLLKNSELIIYDGRETYILKRI